MVRDQQLLSNLDACSAAGDDIFRVEGVSGVHNAAGPQPASPVVVPDYRLQLHQLQTKLVQPFTLPPIQLSTPRSDITILSLIQAAVQLWSAIDNSCQILSNLGPRFQLWLATTKRYTPPNWVPSSLDPSHCLLYSSRPSLATFSVCLRPPHSAAGSSTKAVLLSTWTT